MPKLEEGKTAGTFLLNGLPYQKGKFEIKVNGVYISIVRNSDGEIDANNLANKSVLEDWTDGNNRGFVSITAFCIYANALISSDIITSNQIDLLTLEMSGVNNNLKTIEELLKEQIFLLKSIVE